MSDTIDTPSIYDDLGRITVESEADLPEYDTLSDTTSTGDGIWYEYTVLIEYGRDWHTIQMGVAQSDTEVCSFAVVAGPTVKKRVSWNATKIGVPPVAPDPQTNLPGDVLLTDQVDTVMVDVGSAGQIPIYTLSGEYVYGLSSVGDLNYYFPVPPYLTLNPCSLPTVDMQHGIIDCDTGGAVETLGEEDENTSDEYVPETER